MLQINSLQLARPDGNTVIYRFLDAQNIGSRVASAHKRIKCPVIVHFFEHMVAINKS